MDQSSAPRPRWVRALVVGFVTFELLAAAALVAQDVADRSDRPGPPPAATQPTGTRQDSADRSGALRTTAVEQLLDRRARAIERRDRVAFAATLDRRETAFVRKQLAMFDALAGVPVSDWSYELDANDTAPPPDRHRGEAWAPRVTLRYRLTGFDDEPAATDQFFTFVRRGDAWLVAGDTDYDTTGRRTGRHPWDYGPVAVVRGARSLVLGHPGHHTLLRDVARRTDEAIPRVAAVWTGRWSRKVVVFVPNDTAEAAGILGGDDDLTRIAAVAVAELPGGITDRPVGHRVVVNPPNFSRLGSVGRRVVLTHEVTHVATRDASVVGLPTWLVEGFADYVGYQGTGLSPRAICQELAAEVRRGKVPKTLPSDDDFDGGNERLAQAYEASWLAVRLIAERAGERGLVQVYRRAGTEPLPAVLHDVVGLTAAEFTAAWRGYVRRTIG